MLQSLNSCSHNHHSTSRGFTLIELVVVMVIVAILAAAAALNLNSGSRQTEMKTAAKNLYRNFRFAQEEAILTGKTIAVNISEEVDFDSDNFQQSIFFKFTWLELYTEGQNIDAQLSRNKVSNRDLESENADNLESSELFESDSEKLKKTGLRKRRYILFGTALQQVDDVDEDEDAPDDVIKDVQSIIANQDSDSALNIDVMPADFSFEFSQEDSVVDVALFKPEDDSLTKRTEDDELDEDEQRKKDKKEYTAHIRLYPDGEVDEFKIRLIDNQDTSQGYVIESINGADIIFHSLNEDDS